MSAVTEQEEDDVQIPVPELLGVLLDMEGSDLHISTYSAPQVRERELLGHHRPPARCAKVDLR